MTQTSIDGRLRSSILLGAKLECLNSAHSRLYFPTYREKYLQEAWHMVKSALKEHGIAYELNLVEGSMTVSTTRKTKDPYTLMQARDLIKLLSISVPAPQGYSFSLNINLLFFLCDCLVSFDILVVNCFSGQSLIYITEKLPLAST